MEIDRTGRIRDASHKWGKRKRQHLHVSLRTKVIALIFIGLVAAFAFSIAAMAQDLVPRAYLPVAIRGASFSNLAPPVEATSDPYDNCAWVTDYERKSKADCHPDLSATLFAYVSPGTPTPIPSIDIKF